MNPMESNTLAELQRIVDEFVAQRKWERYHTPKNLAMSIAIEAAELMEHFQWSPSDRPCEPMASDAPVAEEMADVLAYLLRLASVLDIDLASAFRAKMVKNRIKYPPEIDHDFGASNPSQSDGSCR
jgi:NTP pyrophosphatase (non-canonical NTP hydrolase)